MARALKTEERNCDCHIRHAVIITTYSCGCVRVMLHKDSESCLACVSLSDLTKSCGKGDGNPRGHK